MIQPSTNGTRYGLWAMGCWWRWHYDGIVAYRLPLLVAEEACLKLNRHRASLSESEQQKTEDWQVKIIGKDAMGEGVK